ncbi:pyridoxal 5'-phosphate synthase glutaminase subunit PdxT [Murdochiella vaginalis]|uniref:pyridoxal 5'-phosphate synthase glutaminase subunit PdxT n=1 Tax=Murdochiella vaginalis TaxID=1852373 RepID=UPI0008FDBE7B|nr:pyridoxal 5'-phosphate synthase glutaminase subunit PdxT [Murdochiella vaginalis]
MPIGVLALQGAFIEHEKMLHQLGADVREVRQLSDLDGLSGIVLPGGESTVQGRLLRKLHMLAPLRESIQNGMPVLATCAGLILLAQHLEDDETTHLATLPVTVRRNAYGRQLASFTTAADVGNLTGFPLVFIRAPYIAALDGNDSVSTVEVNGSRGGAPSVVNGGGGGAVEVLCTVEDRIVAVRYRAQIGLAFHPELTEDTRLHEAFLGLVKQGKGNL